MMIMTLALTLRQRTIGIILYTGCKTGALYRIIAFRQIQQVVCGKPPEGCIPLNLIFLILCIKLSGIHRFVRRSSRKTVAPLSLFHPFFGSSLQCSVAAWFGVNTLCKN